MENQFVELHTSKVKLFFLLCSLGETCEGYHMWRLEHVFVHREKHCLYLGTYAQSTMPVGRYIYILMVQKSPTTSLQISVNNGISTTNLNWWVFSPDFWTGHLPPPRLTGRCQLQERVTWPWWIWGWDVFRDVPLTTSARRFNPLRVEELAPLRLGGSDVFFEVFFDG